MNGDAHAPGMGGSQPLPPSFTERPPRRLEASDEQGLHPPFFPASPAAPTPPAEPDWADPATYDVAPVEYSEEEDYFTEPAAPADEILPAPEDFGYPEPAAEELTAGEIPADAFLEAPPLPTYEEPVYPSTPPPPPPPLPTYEEPAYAEPAYAQAPLPTYEEPASCAAEPLPAYAGPASPEAEVAERLEALARELRSRGAAGVQTAFSGDALDAALAGLVSGYLAALGH